MQTSESIQGLIIENFITEEEENEIVTWIDQQPWNTTLKRRTQHYGYEYNYRDKHAKKSTTEMSGPLLKLATKLKDAGIIDANQCIINEYLKNQGISAHTDASFFGPVVVSISLLNPCNMWFSNGEEKHCKYLERRSATILTKDARNRWKHEIKPTGEIVLPAGTIFHKNADYRRLSATFRSIVNV